MGTSLLGTDDGIGWGVRGDSKTGVGMEANSGTNAAIRTNSTNSNGVEATGGDAGVLAFGGNFGVKGVGTVIGIRGESQDGIAGSFATTAQNNANQVLDVTTTGPGIGVRIETAKGPGMVINTAGGAAINAICEFSEVSILARCGTPGIAVHGVAPSSSTGVQGQSDSGPGVLGSSTSGTGVQGQSDSGPGVLGSSTSGTGIQATSDTGIALIVNGLAQIRGNSVGQTTLPKGQTSVLVNTSAATPTSNILLTPLDNPRGQLWVTRAAGSFTIHTSAAPRTDVPIAYLIIN